MFGVLRGATCGLGTAERRQWMAHICGICTALNRSFGPFSRIATNYDAALLSTLYSAQNVPPLATQPAFCLLRRPFSGEIVAPDSAGVRYSAAVALLMAASRVRDHVLDGDSWLSYGRGALLRLTDHWTGMARRAAAAVNFDTGPIEAQMRLQMEVEARPGQDFLFYSRPTELAVGAAFAHTATLAGRPAQLGALQEMGEMFGRIIYLWDSYQDYAEDRAVRRFNALQASGVGDLAVSPAGEIFDEAYQRLRKQLRGLELTQPGLVQMLLEKQLHRKGLRLLGYEVCGSEGCRAVSLPPGPEGPGLPGAPTGGRSRRRQNSGCADCGSGCDCGSGSGECCHCCGGSCQCCDCCDCCSPHHHHCWECNCVDCCGGQSHCCACHGADCSGGDCNCCECSGCDCCNGCDCNGCDCNGCDCN